MRLASSGLQIASFLSPSLIHRAPYLQGAFFSPFFLPSVAPGLIGQVPQDSGEQGYARLHPAVDPPKGKATHTCLFWEEGMAEWIWPAAFDVVLPRSLAHLLSLPAAFDAGSGQLSGLLLSLFPAAFDVVLARSLAHLLSLPASETLSWPSTLASCTHTVPSSSVLIPPLILFLISSTSHFPAPSMSVYGTSLSYKRRGLTTYRTRLSVYGTNLSDKWQVLSAYRFPGCSLFAGMPASSSCLQLPLFFEPQGLPWGGLRVFQGPVVGEGLSSPRAQPWSATVCLCVFLPALPAALPPGHILTSRGLRACPGRPSHSLWSRAHTRPRLATVLLPAMISGSSGLSDTIQCRFVNT